MKDPNLSYINGWYIGYMAKEAAMMPATQPQPPMPTPAPMPGPGQEPQPAPQPMPMPAESAPQGPVVSPPVSTLDSMTNPETGEDPNAAAVEQAEADKAEAAAIKSETAAIKAQGEKEDALAEQKRIVAERAQKQQEQEMAAQGGVPKAAADADTVNDANDIFKGTGIKPGKDGYPSASGPSVPEPKIDQAAAKKSVALADMRKRVAEKRKQLMMRRKK